jgi:hypothetical protein
MTLSSFAERLSSPVPSSPVIILWSNAAPPLRHGVRVLICRRPCDAQLIPGPSSLALQLLPTLTSRTTSTKLNQKPQELGNVQVDALSDRLVISQTPEKESKRYARDSGATHLAPRGTVLELSSFFCCSGYSLRGSNLRPKQTTSLGINEPWPKESSRWLLSSAQFSALAASHPGHDGRFGADPNNPSASSSLPCQDNISRPMPVWCAARRGPRFAMAPSSQTQADPASAMDRCHVGDADLVARNAPTKTRNGAPKTT